MKRNKYKIKKWVLIPIFILMCSLVLGFSCSKSVNAYVNTEDLDSFYNSLFPKSIYIQNKTNSLGIGYTFYPFSNSNQSFLDQNINGVSAPIIYDNIVYDNYTQTHRIVADTRTYLYGLSNFYYNYNNFNPFINDYSMTYSGIDYYINGAYGSSDKLGGVLENLTLPNTYIQMDFQNFNIPISFLTNENYATKTDFSNLFNNGEDSILSIFGSFYPLIDLDLQISPYSLCSLYNFSFNLTNSGYITPTLTKLVVNIEYLDTAVYSTSSNIGLKSIKFTYYDILNSDLPLSYISVPDILLYAITQEIDVSRFGSASYIYVSNMNIQVEYNYNTEDIIKDINMSSIFSNELMTSNDISGRGVFFGNNWYSLLNGGEIGGNVSYEIDLSRWLVVAVEGFMNAELFPGFAIGGILAVIVAFPLAVWLIKLILGG